MIRLAGKQRIRLWLLIPTVCLTAPMTTLGAQEPPFEDRGRRFTFAGVSFPSVVDTFAVMHAQRYPDPALGVQLQYRSPMAPRRPFDVYVYPVGAAGRDQSISEVIKAEFDTALEGIEQYPRDDIEVTVEETESVILIGADGHEFRGWRAETTLRSGTLASSSYLYVFVRGGSFFKYRITHDRSLRGFLQDRIEAFVVGTLEAITTEWANDSE